MSDAIADITINLPAELLELADASEDGAADILRAAAARIEALERLADLCLFAVTRDAVANDGRVDCAGVAGSIRAALVVRG